MTEAYNAQCGDELDYTPATALTGGDVIQLSDGRAAVVIRDIAASAKGAVAVHGVFTVPKTASIVILDGGDVYWDFSANKAHFKPVDDRDYLIGVAVGDAASADTTMKVALNVQGRYKVDIMRDPYVSTLVGTAAANGLGVPYRNGGSLLFKITATSEAQKVDALSIPGFSLDSNAIIEAAFHLPNGGSGSASDFSIGAANATHASDADSITDSLFIHLDGGSTTINAECDDGTNEVAATSTTKTFTAGQATANIVEAWMDVRDPSNVKFYIDGVRVLSGTTFNISASTATWKLLAHLEKSAGTETADMSINKLRARTMEQ